MSISFVLFCLFYLFYLCLSLFLFYFMVFIMDIFAELFIIKFSISFYVYFYKFIREYPDKYGFNYNIKNFQKNCKGFADIYLWSVLLFGILITITINTYRLFLFYFWYSGIILFVYWWLYWLLCGYYVGFYPIIHNFYWFWCYDYVCQFESESVETHWMTLFVFDDTNEYPIYIDI